MLAIQTFFENLSGIGFAAIYSDVLRYILPLLALLILWRCGRSLLTFRREPVGVACRALRREDPCDALGEPCRALGQLRRGARLSDHIPPSCRPDAL